MARVRGPMRRATAAGSSSRLSGSRSAKTGVPPRYNTALALATKLMAGTITSSPAPMPRQCMRACSPAVPLEKLTAAAAPTVCAKACSKAATAGPVVSQGERSAATRAWMSSSSIHWRP
jgi:hypothetical protein